MKPIKNKDTGVYYVDARWSGYRRIQVSTRTTNKARAKAMISTLERLKTLGLRDYLGQIANGTLKLDFVHDIGLADMAALDRAVKAARSQALGQLVDEWLAWLRHPSTLAPRTRKQYSSATTDRYAQSWEKFFAVLVRGRETTIADLTKGCLSEYRRVRMQAGCTGSTVNRDIVALQSFLRWAKDDRELDVPTFALTKEAESAGRERWLSAEEIAVARAHCDPDWWILFAMLIHTGMRVSEAQGLTWGDVQLQRGLIAVRDQVGGRRLKTRSSNRDVPITRDLGALLVAHAQTVASRPIDPVFPDARANRRAAHKKWIQVLKRAGLTHATVHDLRHTFGVHALMAGIPLPRLQKLLGHSTPTMTLRYTQHVPQEYFRVDAELLSKSLTGTANTARLEVLGPGRNSESQKSA